MIFPEIIKPVTIRVKRAEPRAGGRLDLLPGDRTAAIGVERIEARALPRHAGPGREAHPSGDNGEAARLGQRRGLGAAGQFDQPADAMDDRGTAHLLAVAGNALKAFPGVGTIAGGLTHAVAYGLIFDALGNGLRSSLDEGGALRPAAAARNAPGRACRK